VARRYGLDPARLIGLRGPVRALDFNVAVMIRGEAEDRRQMQEARERERQRREREAKRR
jgi:hypothetical protein